MDKVRQGSKKGSTDLEAVKLLFNEKEKELANAVSKVNELTQQVVVVFVVGRPVLTESYKPVVAAD